MEQNPRFAHELDIDISLKDVFDLSNHIDAMALNMKATRIKYQSMSGENKLATLLPTVGVEKKTNGGLDEYELSRIGAVRVFSGDAGKLVIRDYTAVKDDRAFTHTVVDALVLKWNQGRVLDARVRRDETLKTPGTYDYNYLDELADDDRYEQKKVAIFEKPDVDWRMGRAVLNREYIDRYIDRLEFYEGEYTDGKIIL